MRVLHFSDVHVGIPLSKVPFSKWFGKRAIGGLNLLLGRSRYFLEAREKIAALDEFRRREKIDLVVSTGDFTSMGLEREYRDARAAVEPLFDAPLGLVSVPGNHDLYVAGVVREGRFQRHFGDTLRTDIPELRAGGTWPYVRLFGDDVAVVGINSARPTFAILSSGRIPDADMAALRRVLQDERVRSRFVFVITHYAARVQDGKRDRIGHGMVNADEFLEVCSDLPRGAILCGHIHHRFHVKLDGVNPAIFCAGSTSMTRHEGLWVFDVEDGQVKATPGGWNGQAYVLDAGSAVDATTLR